MIIKSPPYPEPYPDIKQKQKKQQEGQFDSIKKDPFKFYAFLVEIHGIVPLYNDNPQEISPLIENHKYLMKFKNSWKLVIFSKLMWNVINRELIYVFFENNENNNSVEKEFGLTAEEFELYEISKIELQDFFSNNKPLLCFK